MRDDKERLEKIIECADKIKEYTRDGENEFFGKPLIQDAVVRNLQVIGDAIKDLSEDIREKNPDVEWRGAARMRDRITHDYFDVNYDIVWDTVQNHIPSFREKIKEIHERLIYKVQRSREEPSELEQKLKEKDAEQI